MQERSGSLALTALLLLGACIGNGHASPRRDGVQSNSPAPGDSPQRANTAEADMQQESALMRAWSQALHDLADARNKLAADPEDLLTRQKVGLLERRAEEARKSVLEMHAARNRRYTEKATANARRVAEEQNARERKRQAGSPPIVVIAPTSNPRNLLCTPADMARTKTIHPIVPPDSLYLVVPLHGPPLSLMNPTGISTRLRKATPPFGP